MSRARLIEWTEKYTDGIQDPHRVALWTRPETANVRGSYETIRTPKL